MFKSAATKIAHNTTIPALAGHSDLRPLQDLITSEKTVLTTLQKLRVDLGKAADALRIWGQGEGDDLGDVLTASAAILVHFANAVSTYSSHHHTIRDSMKSVRAREEALDDLRRRRRRLGASADAAERKLYKMSPEHKNLGVQTDTLNRLRDEMRAMDGEIIREETELGDYKRKCTRDWMGFKFGGLVECCDKGVIVGDVGRRIIQFIPEDVTQPGLPRSYYHAQNRVGDLVVEAQQAVSQVDFCANSPEHVSPSAPVSQPPAPTSQGPPAQSPFLPTPSLGSELTLGGAIYSPPPGPPPIRRASVDELGVHASPVHAAPQFSSLPSNKERDAVPTSSPAGSGRPPPLTSTYDSRVARTDENQSLMASIADALSQNQHGFAFEAATSLGHPGPDEPVPQYEALAEDVGRSARSEPHGSITNGDASSPPLTEERQHNRRTTRRSTSPPCLPPGAAPAAFRAWDDRMGQGENGAHSHRPASSSADVPSQRITFSWERDGEDEERLAYDRDSQSFEGGDGIGYGKHYEEETSFPESGSEASVDVMTATHNEQDTVPTQILVSTGALVDANGATALSRAGSQWRIPRVPPPFVGADGNDILQPASHEQRGLHSTGTGTHEEIWTDESADEQARNAAAAREVSRELNALASNAVTPSMSSGHATPRDPLLGYGSTLSAQSQAGAPYPRSSSSSRTSHPPSPILPPKPPFANLGRGGAPSIVETRYPDRASSESLSGRPPGPVPAVTTSVMGGGDALSVTSPGPTSKYRSPPPEYPRQTPPSSSPLMESSTSPLDDSGTSPGGQRTISAAAFRRQQMESPSGTEPGPADTSPLALKKPTGQPSPRQPQTGPGGTVPLAAPVPVSKDFPRARLSVVNPDPQATDEDEEGTAEEFDHVRTYGGESAGYGAGRYVSDLEREMHG